MTIDLFLTFDWTCKVSLSGIKILAEERSIFFTLADPLCKNCNVTLHHFNWTPMLQVDSALKKWKYLVFVYDGVNNTARHMKKVMVSAKHWFGRILILRHMIDVSFKYNNKKPFSMCIKSCLFFWIYDRLMFLLRFPVSQVSGSYSFSIKLKLKKPKTKYLWIYKRFVLWKAKLLIFFIWFLNTNHMISYLMTIKETLAKKVQLTEDLLYARQMQRLSVCPLYIEKRNSPPS